MPKIQKREALQSMTRERSNPIVVRASEDLPDNTLSFVFISDNNAGQRYDWGSGEYYDEVLDVNGANAERLNTFFKDHLRNVDSAIGKISNVRVDGGQVIGDVTFGSDDGSQTIFRKYAEGILTDVSIGYQINEYRVDTGSENERDVVTVTDYDVFEVSAVGVGFDSGAKKRENNNDGDFLMPKEMLERLKKLEAMTERSEAQSKELNELREAVRKHDDANAEQLRTKVADLEAQNKEMARQRDLESVAKTYGADEALLKEYREDTTKTVDGFTRAILDAKMAEQPTVSVGVSENGGNAVEMRKAIEDAIAIRTGAIIANPHADVDMFRHATLSDMAKAVTGVSGYDRNAIAERAMVSGEFPLLLLNAGNRTLESEFDAVETTYARWVKQVDVPDFRIQSDIVAGHGGRLDKTLENGDLKEQKLSEAQEQWKIETFGNKFSLTREMIVNDDLGAFQNMLALFGEKSAITANGLAYDILRGAGDYASYKMADGKAIFHADHANKADVVFSADALSAGRVAMRKHKGIDKKTPLNITPTFLFVSADNEELARKIVYSTASIDDNKNTGVINPHQNSVEIIVDAELQGAEWYLASNRRTVKMGFLQGANRRPILKMNDSSIAKTTFEGVFDIGVMAEDYRGMYKGK